MSANSTKPIAWSYSRLTSFETCPKKFWHTSVQKDFKEPESDDMRHGKKVHKALERRIGFNEKLPNELSYLEPIAAKFSKSHGTKLVEQQLAITPDFEPCEWYGPNVWARCIIDLAIVAPPHAVIVDWKTGKQSDDFTQQQVAAAMFFLFNPDVETIDLMYYWIKDRKPSIRSLARSDAKIVWAAAVKRVLRYTMAHQQANFPPKPSGLCKRHCPVMSCPYHGVGN
jgi:CRISPR/Cas system-associated exonuclease Cas4 (RecB family)